MVRSIKNSANFKVLLSSVLAFAVRVFGAASGFLATFVVAKYLGADESGLYFLSFSLVTVLVAISWLGMENSVIRFVGAQPDLARSVVKRAICSVGISSGLISGFLYISAPYISEVIFQKPNLVDPLRNFSMGVVGLALLTISANALQGLGKFVLAIIILNIAVNVSLILGIVSYPPATSSEAAAYFSVISIVVALVAGTALFFSFPRQSSDVFQFRQLMDSSMPLWLVTVMSQMMQWSGQFVAGIYANSQEVAQLAVAQRTAVLVSFVLIAVNTVVAPKFALLYKNNERSELQELSKYALKITALVAAPIVVFLILFPSFIMNFFGDGFVEGAIFLQIFAIGQLVNAFTGPVNYLLMMSGYERDMKNIAIFSGVFSIAINFLLVYLFGAVGAAVGTAMSVAIQNTLAVILVRKRLGFNIFSF